MSNSNSNSPLATSPFATREVRENVVSRIRLTSDLDTCVADLRRLASLYATDDMIELLDSFVSDLRSFVDDQFDRFVKL